MPQRMKTPPFGGRVGGLFTLVCTVVLAAACVSGPSETRAETAPPGKTTVYTIHPGLFDRTYRLYVPKSLPAGRAVPLVVALHGGYGTAEVMEDMTHFDAQADRSGFVVAYPEGYKKSWNAGSCCDPAMGRYVNDVGFVRAVVEDAKKKVSIDPARVFGTGFSNGAMLVHRIACEAPDVFTAVAAVSGGIMVKDCSPKKGLPMMLVQGRADPRIPWNGGVFQNSYRPSIKEIVANLSSRNGCSGGEALLKKTAVGDCEQLSGCRAGAVVWCGLDGIGHQWAGGRTFVPSLLGQNTDKFDTTAEITAFFMKQ
jgi:polyhydroxybutyrate depolymerase